MQVILEYDEYHKLKNKADGKMKYYINKLTLLKEIENQISELNSPDFCQIDYCDNCALCFTKEVVHTIKGVYTNNTNCLLGYNKTFSH